MRIAFGWYSFKVKSYSAKDLELDIEQWKDSSFEVRQKVFHLFWIPVFSLGKLYALKKQGKLYDLQENIVVKIRNKGRIRTPWYSFLLPILLIAIPIITGIYIYIAESIMKNNHYREDKKQYEIAITDVQNKLQKLSKNAYLRIINTEKPDNEKTLLKLIDFNNNNYRFIIKKVRFPKNSNEKYYFEDFGIDTLTFTKNELQKAICTDYDIVKEYKPYGVRFFGKEKYRIESIEYFDKPVIDGNIDWDFWNVIRKQKFQYYNSRFTGYKNERSWTFKLTFQNFGIPVNLIKIQNIENKIQWTDNLPIEFKSYEYLSDIYVQASTTSDPDTLKFKSKFIFEDSFKNKYEYIVKGDGAWYEIIRN
ncbi:hypothetical protein [Flavobacterium suncheonense]|uniref:Uncharacterized protein n=1 Tax=Flavobacterium suncheonense GH29-5 = DSM 17707 TaxID=1121899 RepID=A0A0A2MNM5_9FLAO|nr:hypothetical protein [Flavobacterium suncheonense]KGO89895.1 hypothetical protein Q764_04605 [Flavobacterium suncheonense GH29-5 = DSM 17707]